MSLARSTLLLGAALAAAGCSGSSAKPGAMFRGPGALAIFDGFVNHDAGGMGRYLAVGNERGDDLRLVHVDDNELVESPGLVFPLSIPTPGSPMLVASADLHDGAPSPLPDALAVVAAGTNEVVLVDTWSGLPAVSQTIALPTDGEVLAMAAVAVTDGATPPTPLPGRARLLVSMTGGRLEIVELTRGFTFVDAASQTVTFANGVTATRVATPPAPLGFDLSSLSPGADPGIFYAGSLGPTPGVYRFALPEAIPTGLAWAGVSTNVPIKAIAAVTFAPWDWVSATFGTTAVERVIAAPVESECGEGKAVRCGLISVDADTLTLTPSWIPNGTTPVGYADKRILGDEDHLIPLALPAPVTALIAAGRSGATIPLAPGSETGTSGVVLAATADGGVYPIDLARWQIASPSPLTGDGKTRVSAASVDEVSGSSRIALWGLEGEAPSAKAANLKVDRVRVTPGYTPDDDWTLSWKGVLPALDTRGAILGRDAGGPWVAVQIDIPSANPVAVADLGALDVRVGDVVELGGGTSGCPEGTLLEVTSVGPVTGAASNAAHLAPIPPATEPTCLPATTTTPATTAVATFRAAGLLLVGAKSGYAGRPALSATVADPPVEHVVGYATFPGRFLRLFYVTDAAGTAGAAPWEAAPYGLSFPFPNGPAVGIRAAFVAVNPADGTESPTLTRPTASGTALRFTTKSGVVAGQRRPLADGTAIASTLPSGMAFIDPGTGGVKVWTSYTAGIVMIFETDKSTGTIAVLR